MVSNNNWFMSYGPRSVQGGIKPHPNKGFATTWWGKKWIEILESFQITQRLLNGKRYAKDGQVMEIDVKGNKISAIVQGSRLTPYEVILEFEKWDDRVKSKVVDIITSNGYLLGPLITGELPRELAPILMKNKIKLFPDLFKELKTSCTCPSSSKPCKHIIAVLYLLALEFDRDPTLILNLRGLSLAEIKKTVKEEREENKQDKKLDIEQRQLLLKLLEKDSLCLRECDLSKLESISKKPPVNALNIKRLGSPPFWRSEIDFIELMKEIYKYFSDWAQDKSV